MITLFILCFLRDGVPAGIEARMEPILAMIASAGRRQKRRRDSHSQRIVRQIPDRHPPVHDESAVGPHAPPGAHYGPAPRWHRRTASGTETASTDPPGFR